MSEFWRERAEKLDVELQQTREENERLQQKLKDYEGCKGIEDYYRVLSDLRECRGELQQTREELDYHKEALAGAENMMHQRLQELVQVKAELAAKDKVLQSIAIAPAYTARRWYRDQAAFILSQYKGEGKT